MYVVTETAGAGGRQTRVLVLTLARPWALQFWCLPFRWVQRTSTFPVGLCDNSDDHAFPIGLSEH